MDSALLYRHPECVEGVVRLHQHQYLLPSVACLRLEAMERLAEAGDGRHVEARDDAHEGVEVVEVAQVLRDGDETRHRFHTVLETLGLGRRIQ